MEVVPQTDIKNDSKRTEKDLVHQFIKPASKVKVLLENGAVYKFPIFPKEVRPNFIFTG